MLLTPESFFIFIIIISLLFCITKGGKGRRAEGEDRKSRQRSYQMSFSTAGSNPPSTPGGCGRVLLLEVLSTSQAAPLAERRHQEPLPEQFPGLRTLSRGARRAALCPCPTGGTGGVQILRNFRQTKESFPGPRGAEGGRQQSSACPPSPAAVSTRCCLPLGSAGHGEGGAEWGALSMGGSEQAGSRAQAATLTARTGSRSQAQP